MKFSSSSSRCGRNRTTPLASALAITLLTGMAATASASSNAVVDFARALPGAALGNTSATTPAAESAYYTIVFKQAALATYGGEVAGLRVPDRLMRQGVPTAKLDVKSPASVAYVAYLESKQQSFINELASSLNRPIDVRARMQHALNAVVVRLSDAEASAVMARTDVLFIEREHELELTTDRGPAFIGATSIWSGDTANGVDTKGEGIIVGVIDTGINWQSPAFAAVGPVDGHVFVNPFGAGTYAGNCQAGQPDAGRCNNKLIGIYNFATAGTTGEDIDDHGSHTASTAAGNLWDATFAGGAFQITGVAPHANVISYKACTTGCSSVATSQSANQALIDGVDALNYSISGGTSPWTDATSTAFRNLVAAGTFVAASAGNTSTTVPNPQGQVNHMEPWVETVAASTEDRIIAVSLDLTSVTMPPANTQNVPMRP
ncbi:S8 family serine peptidase, partial [Dokdonella sp.]|uniref:S8 family serine peptidase n=1 Tax=Dokdonella sp. TaxID=2291710 RepID=UPI003C62BE5B